MSNIAADVVAVALGALLIAFGTAFMRDYRGIVSTHYDNFFPVFPKSFRGRPEDFDRKSLRELLGIPAIVFGVVLVSLGAYFLAVG